MIKEVVTLIKRHAPGVNCREIKPSEVVTEKNVVEKCKKCRYYNRCSPDKETVEKTKNDLGKYNTALMIEFVNLKTGQFEKISKTLDSIMTELNSRPGLKAAAYGAGANEKIPSMSCSGINVVETVGSVGFKLKRDPDENRYNGFGLLLLKFLGQPPRLV